MKSSKLANSVLTKNIPIVSITKSGQNILAELSTVNLKIGNYREACPFDLIPTTSFLSALTLGDALAIMSSEAKGNNLENIIDSHPGGEICRRLSKVSQVLDSIHVQ